MQELLRVSTADAPIGQKHSYWSRQVATHLAQLEIDVQRKIDFAGTFSVRTLGPARVSLIDAEFQSVMHNGDGRDDRVELIYVDEGHMNIRRFHRTMAIGRGEWCVLDEREDYAFTTSARCACIVLQLPGPWARRFVPELADEIISSNSCLPNWERSLAYGLKAIGTWEITEAVLDDVQVLEHLGGLLTLSLGRSTPLVSRHKASIMRGIRKSMIERYIDPKLSAADIASQNRISRRYLHQLFVSEGETFGKQLLKLRLQRAEQVLSDYRFRKLTIAEIAQAAGITDPTIFSRHFRDRYGATPSQFRASRTAQLRHGETARAE
jgi:AraC-like DNA-binding protein